MPLVCGFLNGHLNLNLLQSGQEAKSTPTETAMEIDWASGTMFGFPFSVEVVREVIGGDTRGREIGSDLV